MLTRLENILTFKRYEKWKVGEKLGSNAHPCYIRIRVITNRVISRFKCIWYTGPQRQVVSWDCKWAFSYLFFLVFVPFSFFPNFSSKISPQPFKIETSYLVYRSTTTSCIVGLQMGILQFVLPFVCSFFFLSKSFVKDIYTTLKDRTLYLVYRFTTTSCIVGLKMDILLFVLPFICSFFFLSRFFVKDISTTVLDRNFKSGIQVHNDKLYRGVENGPSPVCSSHCLFFFLSLQIFCQRYLHNRLR